MEGGTPSLPLSLQVKLMLIHIIVTQNDICSRNDIDLFIKPGKISSLNLQKSWYPCIVFQIFSKKIDLGNCYGGKMASENPRQTNTLQQKWT